jgi:hypothetical protein
MQSCSGHLPGGSLTHPRLASAGHAKYVATPPGTYAALAQASSGMKHAAAADSLNLNMSWYAFCPLLFWVFLGFLGASPFFSLLALSFVWWCSDCWAGCLPAGAPTPSSRPPSL